MWEIDIPQIAFANDIVLNALLGISAIHLSSTTPHDATLLHASRSYFDKAITKYRIAITTVTSQTAEAVLVAACLIAHFTWLTAHSKDHKKEQYRIDLQTFQMCKGIKTMVSQTKPWLADYKWAQMFDDIALVPDIYSFRFLESALQDLQTISSSFTASNISQADQEVYTAVVEDITASCYKIARKTLDIIAIEQRLVTFLHRLPSRYIEMLEKEDPIAAALLARNMALFVFVEDSNAWWIHGSGPNRVPYKAVWGIQGLLPVNWLWTMEWPIKVISKEITLGPDEDLEIV